MAQGTTKGVPIDIDGTLANNSDLLVPSQKAVKTYVDGGLSNKVNRGGDTMSGYLVLVGNPTTPYQAATKDYVDTLINGIDWKQSANAATVAALPTYAVTGSGQILTGTANGAIPSATTDGVTLTANQRLLVKNETSTLTPNNGIYVVTQVGSASLPFILTRSSDANTSALLAEATLSVAAGSTLANTQWHCNPAAVPVVIGTTYITFAQIGSGSYSFTSPLVNTGGVISIPAATSSVNGYLSSTDWTNFNTAYTNRITSLTTSGSSGSSTLISNVLNVPTYTLSGLGGQPLATNLTSLSGLTYASTSFVKMTAAGTFALDTTSYQGALTLTTTGTSGASTLVGNTLNIPQYAGATPAGSTGYVQFNTSGAFNGDANLFWDNTNKRFGIGQSTPTSQFHLNYNQNSVTQNDANGILLANSTSAIAGTQSISPAVVWQGNGWQTNTGSSQDVRFRADVIPVQGTTVPNATWRLSASLNGGVYTERMGLYTYTGSGGFTYLDVQSGSQGQVRSGTIGAVDKLNAVTQLEAGNTISSGTSVYKTTNAGANITPKIGSYSTNTSGTKYLSIDNTNSFVLSAFNASGNIISRAGIDIASLTNTAGAESGDLTFLTQSGGTAMSEKMRIFAAGNVGIGTTTNAGYKLDVSGTARFTSDFTCGGRIEGTNIGATGQLQALAQGVAGSLTARTTNAAGSYTPVFMTGSNLGSAGSLQLNYETTNQLSFSATNAGALKVSRAAIGITNLTNTAGSESGDMIFLTQSGGTAMSEKMRIASNGAISFNGAANTGTSGQVLTSAGSGAPPTWTTVSGGGVTTGDAIAYAIALG